MKKKIKTFVSRLRDAWSIIRGRNYVCICYDCKQEEDFDDLISMEVK